MKRSLIIACLTIVVAACSDLDKTDYSYQDCLRDTMQNNINLSANDIRDLCNEATLTVPEPTYDWVDGSLKPANDFTRCYDKTFKEEEARGTEDAAEIAKLLCFYAPE